MEMEKVINKFGLKLTTKGLSRIISILYLASLIPLVLIGRYNYPSADDYSLGSAARQAWVESGSALQVLYAGILHAVEDWQAWMGYFTSSFLMAVPPSVFGEGVYALSTVIILAAISLSTAYCMKQILVRVLGMDRHIAVSVLCALLFVTIQCMPGRVEAFYWYCGASNYMLTHSLLLFFYGRLIGLMTQEGTKRRPLSAALTCALGFLAGGGQFDERLKRCNYFIDGFRNPAGKGEIEGEQAVLPACPLFLFGLSPECRRSRELGKVGGDAGNESG